MSYGTFTPYLTTRTKTNDYHRSHFIIHFNYQFNFAEFATGEQFDFFCETLGIHHTRQTEYKEDSRDDAIYQRFEMDRQIEDTSFWNTDELPDGAKPIKALSNGHIVTCYYYNDGKVVHFYRPNPNAKNVYKPLPTNEHIAHKRIYGVY